MSEFGNYGAYGDGGFQNPQDMDGGGGFNSEVNGSQKQQLRSSLTPVTIKQINEATQPVPDGEFKIHNVELNFISFIGVVRKVDNNTSAVIISVEDGTGTIDVRKWVDEQSTSASEESEKYEKELNKYVFICGALKEFNGKKNIQHATIRPVVDSNEILYHNLSAIACHLKAHGVTAKSKVDDKKENLFVKDSNGMELPKSMSDKVYDVLKEYSGTMPEGVPCQLIAQKLNITDDVALNICSELSDGGKVYSGYDDTSFLCF
ncbi:uncharacterized protein PRCAT00001618001 [Priceomyces carsonii]|uniref:uncharacterized protein n=1 Tax=Priceomyces carsonii TaxID=28549 RepID=UPI002ED8D73C|nr:unnamed protein product [Priceomyces carsonii]